jgi:alkylation response protein AidB-like acyl-CoA dehydrogenase
MDFQPSTDQLDLRDGIAAFCNDRLGLDDLRALEKVGGFDRDLWDAIAGLGVFQLRESESRGGLGLGVADSVIVFEELGRRLTPGPLAWTVLSRSLVEGAADGTRVVGGLDQSRPSNDPILIEHRESLDVLLVLKPDGLFSVDLDRLDSTPVARPLDPLTPVHHATQLVLGEQLAGRDEARDLRLEGVALVSAQLLGMAEATLAIALDYAKEREQFGRSIGSFQAIKHMLSDMFARQELARAAVYAAGASLDHPESGSAEEAVLTAKVVASDSAALNARACIQIHGGMGYTWEVVDHYYLKRSWVLDSTFASGDSCADELGLRVAVNLEDGAN